MTTDTRLLRRVHEWAEARRLRLDVKRELEMFHCEWAQDAEPEVGDMGVPPCFVNSLPLDERCAACQARDPLFRKMVHLKSIERGYFRQLCALVDRRERARKAVAVGQR